MSEILRTPDERFASLPGYDFAPHYLDDLPGYRRLRMHYLDEGKRDANTTFLCLHGEPSWAYLYRKMLPVLAGAGRVVAPDFFGFGRSDKPRDDATYTWDFHRNSLLAFIDALRLDHITLVIQDWGGIYGLTLPMELGDRVERMLVMNTALPTGEMPPPDGFVAWRDYVASTPKFSVSGLMKRAIPGLSAAEAAAYDAPFPDETYKAGVRRFPALVPTSSEMDGASVCKRAEGYLSETWSGKSFMLVGAQDPVLGVPVMKALQKVIRGCPEPVVLDGAGHFVQEHGAEVAKLALAAWG